jgi:hypothetical protein
MNKLSGTIPDALSSIRGLKELYLAHNNLSGLIPSGLQNLTFLYELDLSFNDLQGEVPKGGVLQMKRTFQFMAMESFVAEYLNCI